MPQRRQGRWCVALLLALALLLAQGVLSVHAVHHAGQADLAHCALAFLAASAGHGLVPQAAPVPAPPPPLLPQYRAPVRLVSWATPATQQARAPPLA
jgi:hypothetical protein